MVADRAGDKMSIENTATEPKTDKAKKNLQEKKTSYHHGNLRKALIEEGIRMVHEDGMQAFSLRKLAKRVGVSAAACYNHFANAQELTDVMLEYISDRFVQALRQAVVKSDDSNVMISMGRAYVEFFAGNPHYFSVLFDSENVDIHITQDSVVYSKRNEPFQLFVQEAAKGAAAEGEAEGTAFRDRILAMWAMVHGFAAMANMKGFCYEGDWGALVEEILKKL